MYEAATAAPTTTTLIVAVSVHLVFTSQGASRKTKTALNGRNGQSNRIGDTSHGGVEKQRGGGHSDMSNSRTQLTTCQLKGPGVKATQRSHCHGGCAEVAGAMRRQPGGPVRGEEPGRALPSFSASQWPNPGTACMGTSALTAYVLDTVLNSWE